MMERKVFKCLMSGSARTRLLLMSPHVDNRPPNVIHRCLLEMLMHVIFMARSSARLFPSGSGVFLSCSQPPSGTSYNVSVCQQAAWEI